MSDITPEFLPTDTRFHAVVDSRKLADLISRSAKICVTDGVHPGSDLIQLESVAAIPGREPFLLVKSSSGSIYHEAVMSASSVNIDGKVFVPHEKFLAVVKQLKGDNATITCIGFELQIANGNSLWRIKVPPRATIPVKPESEGQQLPISAEEFNEALTSTMKSSATGMARASLAQIHFNGTSFVSCDGLRMHRKTITDVDVELKYEIPIQVAKLFSEAIRGRTDDVTLTITPTMLSLSTGTEIISTLRSKLEYPEVEKLFISQSVLNRSSIQVIREEFLEAVKSVKTFADLVLSAVHIRSNDDNQIMIQAEDEVGNAAQARIKAATQGKDMVDLKLNYRHLIDALESTKSEVLEIRVGTNSKTSRSSAFIEDSERGFQAILGQVMTG